MKSVGELLAIGVRFLIVKTDTIVLKRAQRPGTVKVNAFVMSCTLICFLHVILATMSTTSIEDWSFLESLYAWFTTFTTIGFGDYIHLDIVHLKDSTRGYVKNRSHIYAMAFSYLCHMFWVLVSCLVYYRALLILLIK